MKYLNLNNNSKIEIIFSTQYITTENQYTLLLLYNKLVYIFRNEGSVCLLKVVKS